MVGTLHVVRATLHGNAPAYQSSHRVPVLQVLTKATEPGLPLGVFYYGADGQRWALGRGAGAAAAAGAQRARARAAVRAVGGAAGWGDPGAEPGGAAGGRAGRVRGRVCAAVRRAGGLRLLLAPAQRWVRPRAACMPLRLHTALGALCRAASQRWQPVVVAALV